MKALCLRCVKLVDVRTNDDRHVFAKHAGHPDDGPVCPRSGDEVEIDDQSTLNPFAKSLGDLVSRQPNAEDVP